MTICQHCGSENQDDVNFCIQCGAKILREKGAQASWTTFAPQQPITPMMVRQPEVWDGGTLVDALRLFVREPKKTTALMEDPNAPNGVILFVITMVIASFTQGYVASRITSRVYLDGEFVVETTGNIIQGMISSMVTNWLLGTLIVAGLIAISRPKQSPISQKNPFTLAASVNGFRSVVDLVYYVIVLVWLPFEPNTLVEVRQSTQSFETLVSPQVIVLQQPSLAYQFTVQFVSIITFAYSYYLLYRVMKDGMKLEGVLYKIVIVGYAGFSIIGKAIQLLSIINAF
ncbi:MAG: zinc ribbon domain-containing protein [Methanobacteriota archaeon]|nr:MAG: zinc ribbon domain-containing protein [Euryarchaeota archaeon]